MVEGQGQTVCLNPKSYSISYDLLIYININKSIYESSSNCQLPNEMHNPKKLSVILPSNQVYKTLLKSNLLNHQFETSAYMQPL